MSTGPTQDQVDIAQALNNALKENSDIWEKISNSATSTSERLQEALKDLKKFTDQTENQQEASEKLTDTIRDYNSETKAGGKSIKIFGKEIKLLTKEQEKAMRVTAALTTAISGLQNGIAATGAAFSLIGGAVKASFSIIKGTIGFFGGLMGGLFKAASSFYSNNAGAVMQANENIRASFGNLQGPIGGMVKSWGKDLPQASKALAAAGTSLFNVLGDTAAQIEELNKIGQAFGEMIVRLGHHVSGAAGKMMLLEKGMGITYETMKTMSVNAEAMGGTLEEQLDSVAISSAHMAKKFGIDVKQIGKGFSQMAADTAHFGDIAPAALAATAAYASKLGIEVKNLAGIMDSFDSFEQAAQSAGNLAEAFGMNIDAMDMMMANNPAERIDQLRKAFQDTGKSVADLSRHELKMLSQQMGGMDIDSMKNALSIPVDEMGFDDFEDAMNEAGEKMTLEESMADIAKSIQKLTNSLADLGSGPLSAMTNGFMRGLERSKEWREMMKILGDYLVKFFRFGESIGRMFADWLGTLGDVKTLWKDFLNFDGLEKAFARIKNAFQDFFKNFKKDPKKAGRDLAQEIIGGIQEYFSGVGGGEGGNVFSGLIEGFIYVVEGFAPIVIEKIASMIQLVADFISGNGVENKLQEASESGIGGAMTSAMLTIFTSLQDTLLPALMNLFSVLFEKVKPFLIDLLIKLWGFVLVKTILTALVQQAVISAISGGFSTFLGTTAAATTGAGALGTAVNPATAVSTGASLQGFMMSTAAMTPASIAKFGVKLAAIALSVLPTLIIFATEAIIVATILKKVPFEDLLKGFATIGMAILEIAALQWVAKLIDPKSVLKTSLSLLAGAALLAIGGVSFALALLAVNSLMKKVPMKEVDEMFWKIISALEMLLILSLAGFAVSQFLGGPQAIAVVAGIAGGAALLAGAGWAFAEALRFIVKESKGIYMKEVEETFKLMIAAIEQVAILAAAGALLGLSLPLIALAAIAFTAAIPFLKYEGLELIEAINILTQGTNIEIGKLEKILSGTILALDLLGIVIAYGAALALDIPVIWLAKKGLKHARAFMIGEDGDTVGSLLEFAEQGGPLSKISALNINKAKLESNLTALTFTLEAIDDMIDNMAGIGFLSWFGYMRLASRGIESMAGFISGDTSSNLDSIVRALNKVRIGDPKEFSEKIDAIGKLIIAVQNLSQIGIEATKMALLGSLFGKEGDTIATTFSLMFGFIHKILGGLQTFIKEVVTLTNGITPDSLKGIEAVAGIISAIASFGSAMSGPLTKIATDQSFVDDWWGSSVQDKITAVVDGASKMMTSISKKLPTLFENLLPVLNLITDAESIEKKANALSSVFNAVVSIVDAVAKLNELGAKGNKWNDLVSTNSEGFERLLENASNMMESHALRTLITSTNAFLNNINITVPKEKITAVSDFASSIKSIFQDLGDLGSYLKEEGVANITAVSTALEDLTNRNSLPSTVMAKLNDEMVTISNNLKDMEINLESIALKPFLDSTLKATGKHEITIKPGQVNMTVNFNVTMDAEQLAVTMHKGNDKTNNKGFFVLTEEAKKSEAFADDA